MNALKTRPWLDDAQPGGAQAWNARQRFLDKTSLPDPAVWYPGAIEGAQACREREYGACDRS